MEITQPVADQWTLQTHHELTFIRRPSSASQQLRFSFNIKKETAVENTRTGDYILRSLASCADFKF